MVPEDRLVAALDVMPGLGGFVGAKKRVAGLRLVATDVDWSHGSGPEVSGPGEAILLAASGRPAALAELDGEGVDVLRVTSGGLIASCRSRRTLRPADGAARRRRSLVGLTARSVRSAPCFPGGNAVHGGPRLLADDLELAARLVAADQSALAEAYERHVGSRLRAGPACAR